jgi:hypothetical protein
MKKTMISLVALIVIASQAFAGSSADIKKEFPDLHDTSGGTEHKDGHTITYVYQTVPLEKVVYTKQGSLYAITHPNLSENDVVTDIVSDDESGVIVKNPYANGIWGLFQMVYKYPAAKSHCEVTIKLKFIDGIQQPGWKLFATGYPNNPENL